MSIFVHKPSLWSRFFWSLAEIFGLLPRSYLAALTDAALLEKAEMLIRLGDQAKAQQALDASARRVIDDPRLLGQLANLQLRNGNKEVARRAHLRAAQAYLQRGMVDDATHVLQQILAVARDCLEARLALGQIAEGRYGHEEAVAHYLEAVKVLTARQEWEGVQELLERVRQLQRVKTVLESDTQMMPPLLPAGPELRALPPPRELPREEQPTARDGQPIYVAEPEGSVTELELASPMRRASDDPVTDRSRPALSDDRARPGQSFLNISESETIADRPSPLHRRGPTPRAPSTVIVEPDLAFPDTTDPVELAEGHPVPRAPIPAIPSTFVRTSAAPPQEARESQLKQPTDIIVRENLPAELMIKFDTAVDFDPSKLRAQRPVPQPVVAEIDHGAQTVGMPPIASPAPIRPRSIAPHNTRSPAAGVVMTAEPVVAQVLEVTPVVRARDPLVAGRVAGERRASVWDRAIVQGPREAITLNVGPEPEPLNQGEASILRRATTGISSVLNGFISGMGKDGGNSKS